MAGGKQAGEEEDTGQQLQKIKKTLLTLLDEDGAAQAKPMTEEPAASKTTRNGIEPVGVDDYPRWSDPSLVLGQGSQTLVRIIDALVGEVSYSRAGYVRFALMEYFLDLLGVPPGHFERQQFTVRRILDGVIKKNWGTEHSGRLTDAQYRILLQELSGLHGIPVAVFIPLLAAAYLGRPRALSESERAQFLVNEMGSSPEVLTHMFSSGVPSDPSTAQQVPVAPEETRVAMINSIQNLKPEQQNQLLEAFGMSPTDPMPSIVQFDPKAIRVMRENVLQLVPLQSLPTVQTISKNWDWQAK